MPEVRHAFLLLGLSVQIAVIVGCAPKPAQVTDVQLAAASKLVKAMTTEPATCHAVEADADLATNLRSRWPLSAERFSAINTSGRPISEFAIVFIEHRGVFLVTTDGAILTLVESSEVMTTEAIYEGFVQLAKSQRGDLQLDRLNVGVFVSIFVDEPLLGRAIHQLPYKIIAELSRPMNDVRRQSLRLVMRKLLGESFNVVTLAPGDRVSTRQVEIDPYQRSELTRVLAN